VRPTLNISDDLLAEAKVLAARPHRSIGAVVDDALRVLLRREAAESKAEAWTFPTGGAGGLQPGVNLDDREALADLLGDNALPYRRVNCDD
jgi:hypothetical protein